jgi:hypothetical protein
MEYIQHTVGICLWIIIFNVVCRCQNRRQWHHGSLLSLCNAQFRAIYLVRGLHILGSVQFGTMAQNKDQRTCWVALERKAYGTAIQHSKRSTENYYRYTFPKKCDKDTYSINIRTKWVTKKPEEDLYTPLQCKEKG